MKTYLFQTNIEWGSQKNNFGSVERLFNKVSPAPKSLIILPELFSTGLSFNQKIQSISKTDETVTFLKKMSKKWRAFILAGTASKGKSGKISNTATLFGPDGRSFNSYSKIHPFSFLNEEKHVEAGNQIQCWNVSSFHIAPFVCYDLRFPEVFRLAALNQANVMVVIANWLSLRHAHWLPLLRARAIENQSYVLGVNRVGTDPKHKYLGESAVFNPNGELIAKLGKTEGVLEVELDQKLVVKTRKDFPALSDIRTQFQLPLNTRRKS